MPTGLCADATALKCDTPPRQTIAVPSFGDLCLGVGLDVTRLPSQLQIHHGREIPYRRGRRAIPPWTHFLAHVLV